ncbi:MAG: glycosyltransferase family 2 protein, partial [Acidimicrobiales bacterium]
MVARFERLSVFFPAWNEEASLAQTVDAASEVCRGLVDAGEVGDYELLIVDDASTDDTGDLADKIAASDPRVRVVHH